MKYSKLMLGIAFLSSLCLAGCSDGSSGGSNSDGNKGVLDLRIQNNGTIATSSKFIENEAGSSADSVVQDVGTYIDIFYGDKDWGKNTDWFIKYESEETVKESCSIELKHWDGRSLEDFGAKTFFAQYSFTFSVPDCPQVTQWRTVTLDTDLVEVN